MCAKTPAFPRKSSRPTVSMADRYREASPAPPAFRRPHAAGPAADRPSQLIGLHAVSPCVLAKGKFADSLRGAGYPNAAPASAWRTRRARWQAQKAAPPPGRVMLDERASRSAPPSLIAALLNAGATLGAGLPRRRTDEAAVGGAHARRLLVVALLGAAIAPACPAWRLQHAGSLAASLLLNFEAVFTLALAWAICREPLGDASSSPAP